MKKFRQLSQDKRQAWILATLALTLFVMICTSMFAVVRTLPEDGLNQLAGYLALLGAFLMSPFMIRKIRHGMNHLASIIDEKLIETQKA